MSRMQVRDISSVWPAEPHTLTAQLAPSGAHHGLGRWAGWRLLATSPPSVTRARQEARTAHSRHTSGPARAAALSNTSPVQGLRAAP